MESFTVSACIRGFHLYNAIWKPQQGENLSCYQESKNMYDMYAVAVKKTFSGRQLGIPSYFSLGDDVYREEKIVGHIPRYISRLLGISSNTGGIISAKVSGSPTFSRDLQRGGRHVPAELMFSCADAKLLCRCQELVTVNLSGLFGNPQIANKSLLVTVTTESESEDEEYDLTNDSQNEERTGSNRAASHSCSSGASAAACTDVVSILETSTELESVIIIDRVCLIVLQ